MFLHIRTHGSSNRSVACLEDTRLERSLECKRREGELKTTSFKHTLNPVRVPGRYRP